MRMRTKITIAFLVGLPFLAAIAMILAYAGILPSETARFFMGVIVGQTVTIYLVRSLEMSKQS